MYGVDTALALEKTIAKINNLVNRPDVIIVTGDLAEDGSGTTYQRFRTLLSEGKVTIPVYVLPGNHDDISQMRSAFNGDGIYCTSAEKLGDWGVIFVNSQVIRRSYGYVNPSELAELKKNISSFDGLPILVAIHHTPSELCPSYGCQLKNSEEFTTLINSHENIKGVIAGHIHTASEIDVGSHTQFTTPSTFAHASHAQLGEAEDHNDYWACHSLDGSRQGFRVLDLSSDGSITSEVHWLEH